MKEKQDGLPTGRSQQQQRIISCFSAENQPPSKSATGRSTLMGRPMLKPKNTALTSTTGISLQVRIATVLVLQQFQGLS